MTKELWLVVMKWGKKFGDVVYNHVFGQGLVFLNSPEVVNDLLDMRGSVYSDKPQLVMVGELRVFNCPVWTRLDIDSIRCGCENMVASTGYGDKMRRQRKLLTSALGVKLAMPAYHPLMEEETQVFMRRLLATPDKHLLHTHGYAGGFTLSVIYGYTVSSNNDQFLQMAEECVDILSNRIVSGGGIWPMDIFPSLKNWPLWAPRSGFRRNAMVWKAKMEEFVKKPFEYTLRSLTITTVMHFIFAMILHPEVLDKACQEIDNVIGTKCLPTFCGPRFLALWYCSSYLAFIDAILKETWRWSVPVPLRLPHRLMEDDVYRDMFIPKGTLYIFRSILHDESIYPNPDAFESEKRRDVRNYSRGSWRHCRTCPGAHLVDMLATLDIQKSVDDAGNVIEPVVEFDNSVFNWNRTPNPYKCTIKPRSGQAVRVISQAGL
ncbi:cytochrome P450 [Armillaria borealis]|uniref:Cytochrome P450 n=1 Tax=Armillaria borealis TaxID=47425 RepID=A0AA39ME92_9AGAR|nr:cytochrome P450 [Armillaria borealis]